MSEEKSRRVAIHLINAIYKQDDCSSSSKMRNYDFSAHYYFLCVVETHATSQLTLNISCIVVAAARNPQKLQKYSCDCIVTIKFDKMSSRNFLYL